MSGEISRNLKYQPSLVQRGQGQNGGRVARLCRCARRVSPSLGNALARARFQARSARLGSVSLCTGSAPLPPRPFSRSPGSRQERPGRSPGKSGVIFLSNDRDKRSPGVVGKRNALRRCPRHIQVPRAGFDVFPESAVFTMRHARLLSFYLEDEPA